MSQDLSEFVRETYAQKPKLAAGSAATLSTYQADVSNLNRFFRQAWCLRACVPVRNVQPEDFSRELLSGCLAWLVSHEKRTAATTNRVRRGLLAIWRYAHRLGRAPALPVHEEIERLAEPKIEPRCWSPEELGKIFDSAASMSGRVGDVAAGEFFLAHCYFVYNTGVRISAVMGTPAANLDLTRGEVQVPWAQQKQRADQTFDLLPETLEALHAIRPERHLPKDGQRGGCIFDDWPYDRTVRQWPSLTDRYKQILRRAGLACTRRDLFHKLRRTFATFLAAERGIMAACEWLGHSHVSVTWRYIDKRFMKGPRLADTLPRPRPSTAPPKLRIVQLDSDVIG